MRAFFKVIILIFLFTDVLISQHYPGGVADPKIWYKPNFEGDYINFGDYESHLDICGEITFELFNFNPSMYGQPLCLQYLGPLESTTTHQLFMVSEPKNNQKSFMHINTRFNGYVPQPLNDSLSRNTYVFETQEGYASGLINSFSQHQNTHIHHYNWYNYDSDKKFKSYGAQGETLYTIGRYYPFPELNGGVDFEGLFPEFIIYDKILTDNEKNRIESYLALKYGITLDESRSYKNSMNKTFWRKQNNNLFRNHIFGIGRDDVSGLHQVQCESAHHRDYLVAATIGIHDTNIEVLDTYGGIDNNNFLVFGDTGNTGLNGLDQQNLRKLQKVWLSQSTGDFIRETPIHFRLDLTQDFQAHIPSLISGNLVLWMLHDRYADNSYVSSFNNGYVEYYKPTHINQDPNGKVYAEFQEDNLHFDQDKSLFDQFTFAIGPEILIQVRYLPWQCEGECFEMEIEITGGIENHQLFVYDENNNPVSNIVFDRIENEKLYHTAHLCGNQNYNFVYQDVNNQTATYEFYVEARHHSLDLGGNQYLNNLNSIITLNAGEGINDPNAKYEWYYNGNLLEHTGTTFPAGQLGEYCVTVTTEDMSCQLRDCIQISHTMQGHINVRNTPCYLEGDASVKVIIETGTPPYTVNITGNNYNQTQVFDTSPHLINTLPNGNYTILVTDALGESFSTTAYIHRGSESYVSIGPDQVLSSAQPSVILDTSPQFDSFNFSFQWYKNGIALPDVSPQFTVDTPGNYKVVAKEEGADCDVIAEVEVTHEFDAHINVIDNCTTYEKGIEVIIDYGFPPYTTTINGTQHLSNSVYTYTQSHTGDINILGVPLGDYTVTVKDKYGNVIYKNIYFNGIALDLEQQLIDLCIQCGTNCTIYQDYCEQYQVPQLSRMYFFKQNCFSTFTLDASVLISAANVSYQWVLNGIDLNHNSPTLSYGYGPCTYGVEYPYRDENYDYCDGHFTSVTVTDLDTGCSVTETVATVIGWCPILTTNNRPATTNSSIDLPASTTYLQTKIYPSPSAQASIFYYEVSSEESFQGTVEVLSVTGALIESINIQGQAHYKLPFSLMASGTYFIRTRTPKTSTIDRIIIK